MCYPITNASVFPFLWGSEVSFSIVVSYSYESEEISTTWISSLNAETQPQFPPFVSHCSSTSFGFFYLFASFFFFFWEACLKIYWQDRLSSAQKWQLPLTWVCFSASLTKPMSKWSHLLLNKLDNSTEKNYLGVVQPLTIILLKAKI